MQDTTRLAQPSFVTGLSVVGLSRETLRISVSSAAHQPASTIANKMDIVCFMLLLNWHQDSFQSFNSKSWTMFALPDSMVISNSERLLNLSGRYCCRNSSLECSPPVARCPDG